MANPYTPVFLYRAVNGATVINLTTLGTFGTVYVINKSAIPVYMAFSNVAPAASMGDGRKQIIQYETVNLENVYMPYLSFNSGGAADVEIILIPRSDFAGGAG